MKTYTNPIQSPAGERIPFSCLGVWGVGSLGNLMPLGASSAPPRRHLGVNGKTNAVLIVFDGIAFSCSVALKLLGASSAPPRRQSDQKHPKTV